MTALQIRDAVAADAEAACEVMRRSIAELCTADHRDDPEILAQWLANKRPEIFRGWMTQPGKSFLVATEGGSIRGVGSVSCAASSGLGPPSRLIPPETSLLKLMQTTPTACPLDSMIGDPLAH